MAYTLNRIRNYFAAAAITLGAIGVLGSGANYISTAGVVHRLPKDQRQMLEVAQAYALRSADLGLTDFERENNKRELEFLLRDPKIREIVHDKENVRKVAGLSLLLLTLCGLSCVSAIDERTQSRQSRAVRR